MRFLFERLWLAVFIFGAWGNCAALGEEPQKVACDAAAGAAEQAAVLPANMLVSIGRVETGRTDPATGQVTSWPWTVNVDGSGHYFQSEQDAAGFVQLAESSGARDIDVGCFQISLENHPEAFNSLDAAFDPVANAGFAARFLQQLKAQNGTWGLAIADYHSAKPALGLPYRQRVLDAWRGFGTLPLAFGDPVFAAVDPVMILQAPAARLVQVITMDGVSGPKMARLPRVITP